MGYPNKLVILIANAFRGAGCDLKRAASFLVPCFLPIAYTLILDVKSFVMGWNQGRGGLLFALALLTMEYFVERSSLEPRTDKRNTILLTASLVAISIYFTFITFNGLQQCLLRLGQLVGSPLLHSWVWAWDYIVFALYLTFVLALSFGAVGLRKMVAAIVYLFGMAVILLLDAFFPYDTLGPLQYIVPTMLLIDLFLLRMVGVGQAFVSKGNILTLPTRRGPFSLAVFWPSAGVHSMIIYSLIMLVFLIKVPIVRARKVLYFTVGAVGTFFVNVFRIFLLSTYVVFVSSEVAKFEEFHAMIGEIIFIPWVVGFILIVTWLASRERA